MDGSEPASSGAWELSHAAESGGDVVWAVPAPIEPGDPSHLSGATITVVDDGRRVAPLVAVLLESHGARALLVDRDQIPDASDGIIHLGHLHAPSQAGIELFEEVYPVAMSGASTVVAVTGLGGTHGRRLAEFAADGQANAAVRVDAAARTADVAHRAEAADSADVAQRAEAADSAEAARAAYLPGARVSGLFGALAEDLPGANVRAVDVDCFDDPVVLAGRIVAEAFAAGGPVAVGYRDDRRCALVSTDLAVEKDDAHEQVAWGA